MFRKCCVPGCDSERKDVKLHKMPINRDKAWLWLKVLVAAVPSASLMFEDLTWEDINKLNVCHKHFERKYVLPSMRLASKACPTLFSSQEICSGTPTKTYDEIELMEQGRSTDNDHTYSGKRHYDHSYAKDIGHMSSKDIPELVPSTSQSRAEKADVGPLAEGTNSVIASTSHCDHMVDAGTVVAAPSIDENAPQPDVLELQDAIEGQKYTEQRKTLVCRKKLVPSIKKLSPRCRELYEFYKRAKKQLDYHKRAKMAVKASKDESFSKLLGNMNTVARKFLWMQIKLCTKNKKARRFTLDEKVIALSVMKQSPKCYRFLQRIFILPSKSTLDKLLTNVDIEAGINRQVLDVLKQEVSNWKENKKLCSIIYDEMKLDAGLHFSKKNDNISGFVHLSEKNKQFADHALTFMIKGAVYKWQQPIAFYYSKGAASGPEVKMLITEIVAAVCDVGLQPVALISDQGTTFQKAIRSLQGDTSRLHNRNDGVIHLCGQWLSVIYDPPHLIKGMRNNLLTKNIVMNGKTAKWQDLVDVYRADCRHAQMRLLHKLNDEHILPQKIKKMKVKNCVRVFSKTMAAALSYTASFSHYADGTPVSETLSNTAELVSFLDDLFDSVNGASTDHKRTRGKKLRSAVTETSEHHAFWEKAIDTLRTMKFVNRNGQTSSVPSLKNWVTTLRSFQRLWQVMKEKNIKIIRPRYLNSDAIENFFGRVRSYNARNNDPTCHSFACTFKSLLVTNLIKFHEGSYNCEDDCSKQVLKIQSLFDNANKANVTAVHVNDSDHRVPSASSNSEHADGTEGLRLQAARERLDVHSRAYTAGWVIRKVLKKFNCNDCEKDFTSCESSVHKWITHREYETMKKKLTYPSVHVVRHFGYIIKITNEYLDHNAHKNGIKKNITKILRKYSFDFLKCEMHRDAAMEYFISMSVTLCIFNWCNIINKILKGTDVSRLDFKNLPCMQAQALDMYKKRLKNKSLYKYMILLFQKLFQYISIDIQK